MSDSQLLNYGQNINIFGTVKSQTLDYGNPKSLPATLASDLNGTGITSYNFEVTATQLFNQITGPIFGSEFIRHPLHKGTKGVLLSVDTDLGNMTGLGPSTASPTSLSLKPGNLNPALFIPVGNTAWEKVLPNHVVQYGIPPDPQATDQTYGTAHYDQVPSKSMGQKTFTNNGSGVTHTVNIGPITGTSLASHVINGSTISAVLQTTISHVLTAGNIASNVNGILHNINTTSITSTVESAVHSVTSGIISSLSPSAVVNKAAKILLNC